MLVTHDVELAAGIASRTVELVDGAMVRDSGPGAAGGRRGRRRHRCLQRGGGCVMAAATSGRRRLRRCFHALVRAVLDVTR